MRCHAGAGHNEPTDCGVFGWLCCDCWNRVQRIIERVMGR